MISASFSNSLLNLSHSCYGKSCLYNVKHKCGHQAQIKISVFWAQRSRSSSWWGKTCFNRVGYFTLWSYVKTQKLWRRPIMLFGCYLSGLHFPCERGTSVGADFDLFSLQDLLYAQISTKKYWRQETRWKSIIGLLLKLFTMLLSLFLRIFFFFWSQVSYSFVLSYFPNFVWFWQHDTFYQTQFCCFHIRISDSIPVFKLLTVI